MLKRLQKICAVFTTIAFFIVNTAYALPVVSEVVNGDANIVVDNNTMNITALDKTIINFSSFNILENESVVILLPSQNSQILNRVLGKDATQILGNLTSNGVFILINESGIYIGPKANINVGGLIISTRDIANSDFIKGDLIFKRLSKDETDRLLLNEGTIKVREGGFGVLIAGGVENRGTIIAPLGQIVLVGVDSVTLDIGKDNLISIAVDKETASQILDYQGKPITDQIANSGLIEANGGVAILEARSLPDIFEKAINLTGTTKAAVLNEHDGIISLKANGAIVSNGDLAATKLIEQGASFKVGGKYKVGQSQIENDDNAVTLATGDYSGEVSDATNIIIDTNARINLIEDTILRADSDVNGSGAITMNSGSSIVGNNYDLDLYASQASTLKDITGVNTLTINESKLNSKPVYTSNPVSTILQSTNFTIATGKFNRFTGTGITTDPYLIYDVYGLQGMQGYLSSNFKLNNNIDATDTLTWNGGLGFLPVGEAYYTAFYGTLNGDNHKISGLYINNSSDNYVGLFGTLQGATVSNLNLENINIIGYDVVGGIAGQSGRLSLNTSILNCQVSGTMTGNGNVGMITGYNLTAIVANSNASGTVNGYWHTGGLVGLNDEGATISSSSFSGDIISKEIAAGPDAGGDTGLGGLVGRNRTNSIIQDSWSSGTVSGYYLIGGLVGYNHDSATVTNSYSASDVTAYSNGIGGLIGLNESSNISNCYATGSVESIGDFIGGLIGKNYLSTIENSYATGDVSGNADVGGLIGWNKTSDISGSYALGDATAIGAGAGGFVGYSSNDSNISYSYSKGDVIAGGSMAGGFIGINMDTNVSNCYTISNVEGGLYTAGFIGNNNSSVTNSFAVGTVTSNTAGKGGFVGWSQAGSEYENCLWNIEVSGLTKARGDNGVAPLGISGKTTLDMQNADKYVGWDFIGPGQGEYYYWTMINGYPEFEYQQEHASLGNTDTIHWNEAWLSKVSAGIFDAGEGLSKDKTDGSGFVLTQPNIIIESIMRLD